MGLNGTKPYVVWQEWSKTPLYSDVPLTVFINGDKPTKKKPREYEPEKLNSFFNPLRGGEYWLVYDGKERLDPNLILELVVRGWPRTSSKSLGLYEVGKLAQEDHNKFRDQLKRGSSDKPLDEVVGDLVKYIAPALVTP